MMTRLLDYVWPPARISARRKQRKTRSFAAPRRRRPVVEQLEARQLLSTLPAGFQDDFVVGGLYEPTSMAVSPDGRIFVAEKPYGVRVIENGQLLPTPFVTLPVERGGERGVDGIVLDPNFAQNGYVYVYYTRRDETGSNNRLSRFTVSSTNRNVAEAGSERVLIDGIPTMEPGYHNGGVLQFGADGMLYVGIGDTLNTALPQDLSKLQGKILRLNVAAYPNMVPADNPYVGVPGARGEVWARGFRNPFTGAMLPGTNRLFVNDVGSNKFEEINEIVSGANYGWPLAEGASTDPNFTNPLYAYPHPDGSGSAIAGGAFYTGSQFPSSFAGAYFFSDYVQGFVRRLNISTGVATDFGSDFITPIDVGNSPDGNLYVLSLGFGSAADGELRLIRYVGENRSPQAVATADVTAGLAPLVVNFDGSASSDPDGDAITYLWDFGDGQTATGKTAQHTYTTNGTYTATLTASDGARTGQSQPIVITVGNRAPQATISLPAASATYFAGETIQFSGSGFDPEDGALPASSMSWRIVFHHNDHTHPFINSIPGVASGSFLIPQQGEPDPNQWYRIHLTATDSGGLTHTSFTDVRPQTSTFSLATNPAGGTLLLDGQPLASPTSVTGVVNMTRTLEAPSMQLFGGRMYSFNGWSDGGAETHTIATPTTAKTYTASYQSMSRAAVYTSSPPTEALAGQVLTYTVKVKNVGTETWRYSGTKKVRLGVYFGGPSDSVGAWSKEPARFAMTKDVAPGSSFTFTVKIKAPTTPGAYVLRHRMVKENVAWFRTLQKIDFESQVLAAAYQGDPPLAWAAGKSQSYTLTVTNTGVGTWKASGTNPVQLGVYFGGLSDTPGTGINEPFRFALPHDVAAGQSVTFAIELLPPTQIGDYVLRHRMVKENVAWFPEILRTSVTVESLVASYAGSPPVDWLGGETKSYSITVTNTGSRTWNATGDYAVMLGVYFGGASDAVEDFAAEPQRFALPHDVTPGQSATVLVNPIAPLEPASYVLRHRMVKEDVGWFDRMLKTNVTVESSAPAQTLAASYDGVIPTLWTAGEIKTYALTVTNTGTATWNVTGDNPVNLGVYFGGSSDAVGAWDSEPRRVDWPAGVTSVAPGQSVTFMVTVQAPAIAGSYILRHRLVKEHVMWLDDMLRTNTEVAAS